MAPTTLDQSPSSEEEQKVILSENVVLRHAIPKTAGIVIFFPSRDRIGFDPSPAKPSDPDPILRWNQDGFAVVAITNYEGIPVAEQLKTGLDVLQRIPQVTIKDKFAVFVYEPSLINKVSDASSKDGRVACFVGFGSFASPSLTAPIVLHLTANAPRPGNPPSDVTTIYTYSTTSPFFVFPKSTHYDAGSATQANSRTLQFIQQRLLE